jgi:hypothetical protein
MLDNDPNRNRVTGTDPNRPGGMSRGLMALIAGIAVLAVLFMWAPWNGPKTANVPGTSVGSSTRPVTSTAPVAREPAIPAAPSTSR